MSQQHENKLLLFFHEHSMRVMVTTLVLLVVLFCSFVIWHWLSREDVFPIRQVAVSGSLQQLKTKEIQSVLQQQVKGNFFTLSVEGIYQGLVSLPWIDKVWIHRKWPDAVSITVQEQVPVAVLKGKGLLNTRGELFVPQENYINSGLPEFDVVDNYRALAVASFQRYSQLLSRYSMTAARYLFDNRKQETLILSNGIRIVMGNSTTYRRLERFLKTYAMTLEDSSRKVDVVDLRYANGFAVKWQQSAAKLDYSDIEAMG